MIKVRTAGKLPGKAEHICYLITNLDAFENDAILSRYHKYLEKKSEEKKNQIIRLLDGKRHILAVLIRKDVKKSISSTLEKLRVLGSDIAQKLNSEKAGEVYVVNGPEALDQPELLCVIEGLILRNYQFNRYKTDKKSNTLEKVFITGVTPKESEINELINTLIATVKARDLVNEPVITLNTLALAKEISNMADKCGFKARILHKKEIEKLGMGGLLGVNRGSVDPPVFAILEWEPRSAKNKRPYVLVGKGVVYDTGGYNIKTGSHMTTMKCDMSGAAAVIGTLMAASLNKLPLHIIGLIPATDNRIGGNALVADDVIKMYDGTYVEVLNTDAEGRLILADALAYAKRYKPKLVIDLATLTGAASAITGHLGSAVMGSADEKDKNSLKNSGEMVYERLAEMPWWEEYGEFIKSKVADIKNVGAGFGGAITAGKFLEYFTDYPWIHIDIAGPAFIDKDDGYKPAGGTGVGVRLLYHFLKSKTVK